MRRFFSALLCILLLCSLIGCGADSGPTDTTSSSQTAPSETTSPKTEPGETAPTETEPPETEPSETDPPETEPSETEPTETEPTVPPSLSGHATKVETVTLMIYMIGSDLEAKSSAGTNDMTEIAASGVDLSRTNVLVYAGGTRRWHNDTVESKDVHTLLELTDNGFVSVSTKPESSMGEAACLTDFLATAYRDYPADSYALILWDHGNGPLIGYGQDMLHSNDSLTLREMADALAASPFSKDNRLAWIGFDACLMASAELACVLDEYAELLVASQEIEPAFGWNYSFLKNLSKVTPVELLTGMTAEYLATCQAYYASKGYDHRDTTLACMDLSQSGVLERAIETLFQAASKDIQSNYNQLTASRVNVRALGRATTGSEYDLIDLYDLASQMAALYPTESAAIQSVVQTMVLSNSTNTDGCCGMSLYYPFYNKKYYERSWGAIYADLGVFPQYAGYLDSYATIWLGNDLLENVATSVMPSVKGNEEFTLELTPEQAEAFAEGRYYILQREGDQLYTKIFSSGNVTKVDNRLIALFDGQVLYAQDAFGGYILPVATEHDTIGDLTRYSIYANLTNERADMFDTPEGYEYKVEGHRFHICANNRTKQVYTSALVPCNTEVQTDALTGGKIEDADLSQWSVYYFLQERHRYLTRYDNGVIQPVDQWPSSSFFSAYTSKVGDGVKFFFAPLLAGEYYLIFEIEDTQGSRYCSDLLPITADGVPEARPFPTPIETTWSSGTEVPLTEQQGVSLYMTTATNWAGQPYLTLKAVNNNDFDVYIWATNIAYDDSVWCPDGRGPLFSVGAHSTAVDDSGFSFGCAADIGAMDHYSSIQFSVEIGTAKGDKTLIRNQFFGVSLSDQTAVPPQSGFFGSGLYPYNQPTRDIWASEQVLFEKDGLKAILLGFGGEGDDGDLNTVIRYENHDTCARTVKINGMVLGGIYFNCGGGALTIPAGCVSYKAVTLYGKDLDLFMITSPDSLTIQFQLMEYATLEGGGGFSEVLWSPVTLTQKGSGCDFNQGQTLLFEEKGLRIALHHTEKPFSTTYWYCTATNDTGEDIHIAIQNVKLNGNPVQLDSFSSCIGSKYGCCGNGQQSLFALWYDGTYGNRAEVTFEFVIYDITAEQILWVGTQSVTLTC